MRGARPASNWINRRRKPCYIKAFGNSILNAFKMLGGKRGQRSLANVRAIWYNRGKREQAGEEEWNSGSRITGETW